MDEVLCYARGLFLFSAPVDIILDLICACRISRREAESACNVYAA